MCSCYQHLIMIWGSFCLKLFKFKFGQIISAFLTYNIQIIWYLFSFNTECSTEINFWKKSLVDTWNEVINSLNEVQLPFLIIYSSSSSYLLIQICKLMHNKKEFVSVYQKCQECDRLQLCITVFTSNQSFCIL